MSHKVGHVIIDGLVATGKFPPADCDCLEEIAHRDQYTLVDCFRVARIVFRRLRRQ